MPRPRGIPKTGGRRKGTPNKKTVTRAMVLQHALLGGELPHDTLARLGKHYAAIGEQAYGAGKLKQANELFSIARQFLRDAASFFAPKRIAVRTGDEGGLRPMNIALVNFERADCQITTPMPDLIEHRKPIDDIDFDDPEPIAKTRRNGG